MKDLATFYGEDKTYVFKGKINLQEAAIDKQVTMNEWRNLKSIIFQRRKAHCEKMDGKISKSQSQDEKAIFMFCDETVHDPRYLSKMSSIASFFYDFRN